MTKAQLARIRSLAHELDWDETHLRRITGIRVFHRPDDTPSLLATSITTLLESALARADHGRPKPAPRPQSTPRQRAYIRDLLKRCPLNEEEAAAMVGAGTIDELDIAQASDLIDKIR